MSRDNFNRLLDLVQDLEGARLPRADVRQWFVESAHAWLSSAGKKALHEQLGVARRCRRDYLQRRQQDYLETALDAFCAQRSGTAWELAEAFVGEIKRFQRAYSREMSLPSSALRRSLWCAARLPLSIPTTRRHWFDVLKRKGVSISVNLGDGCASQIEGDEMYQPKGPVKVTNTSELRTALVAGCTPDEIEFVSAISGASAQTTRASASFDEQSERQAFARDQSLRHEFNDDIDTYLAYRRADASGRVRVVGAR
jgi:hypothetical protein